LNKGRECPFSLHFATSFLPAVKKLQNILVVVDTGMFKFILSGCCEVNVGYWVGDLFFVFSEGITP